MPTAANVFDQIGAPCTRTLRPLRSARFLSGLLAKMLRMPPPEPDACPVEGMIGVELRGSVERDGRLRPQDGWQAPRAGDRRRTKARKYGSALHGVPPL